MCLRKLSVDQTGDEKNLVLYFALIVEARQVYSVLV